MDTIGFIGFGLIGGSIARAFKKEKTTTLIKVYQYQKEGPGKGLKQALTDGTIDRIERSLSAFCDCDIIFLCAPVLANIAYLKELKPILSPRCILTDVGSVKGNIHQAVAALGLEENFIGGHPMAGSEKTGYENSSPYLLENAFYILTPTPSTKDIIKAKMTEIVKAAGAIPIILNAEEHDDITAAISHVPHIIAASLVNLVKKEDQETEKMRTLAAGGFRDITRIASSSPVMWQNICLTNTDSILKFLRLYRSSLLEIEEALGKGNDDFLYRFFEDAKEYRDSIPGKIKGAIGKIYEVYIDIIDETGAIATIATILASNGISIKNIGILHNREFEDGVLRIELYDQASADRAQALLKQYRYTIYDR